MKYSKYALCLLLPLMLNLAAGAQQNNRWPDHKKAVIVLTYDDALDSQLRIAVPQLDSAGFKGTFFITGDVNSLTIPLWRKLSKRGHELGNHTLFHPCAPEDSTEVSAKDYTPYKMMREIEMMNRFLFTLDTRDAHTYAYPCTETVAGGIDYVDTLRKYGIVKYARAGGDADAIVSDFKALDPLKVPSYGLEDNTPAEKLIAYVDKVRQSGGMGIIMFHGIGGDYITTPAKAHRALLDYLKENKKDFWVTTFREAMDYAGKMKE